MDAGWSGEANGADMLEASVLGAGEGEGKDDVPVATNLRAQQDERQADEVAQAEAKEAEAEAESVPGLDLVGPLQLLCHMRPGRHPDSLALRHQAQLSRRQEMSRAHILTQVQQKALPRRLPGLDLVCLLRLLCHMWQRHPDPFAVSDQAQPPRRQEVPLARAEDWLQHALLPS